MSHEAEPEDYTLKHIVEAPHGGTATADSAGDGRGPTFVVRLRVPLLVP